MTDARPRSLIRAQVALEGPAGPIPAWLASPADAGRRRLPTIPHIHGGPTGAWGPGGMLDAMALCAAGYRVLMPNIRGSATFGGPWVRAAQVISATRSATCG